MSCRKILPESGNVSGRSILRATWNPAKEIKRTDLGHLTVGAPADITVLNLRKGVFGFVDVEGGKLMGTQKLECELTVRKAESFGT